MYRIQFLIQTQNPTKPKRNRLYLETDEFILQPMSKSLLNTFPYFSNTFLKCFNLDILHSKLIYGISCIKY